MAASENRFNLVDEPWIPVAGEGLASLRNLFSFGKSYRALGGNPVLKIALTKFLLAIGQAASTPQDDTEWASLGPEGLAKNANRYLDEWRENFWLYGEKPFLQFPQVNNARVISLGTTSPSISTGNTTVLTQTQVEKPFTDTEKAQMVIQLMGFALGGKQIDETVVLSPGYTAKTVTGKPGPLLGAKGYLHSFLLGRSILESLWLNLVTHETLEGLEFYPDKLGCPPWEKMPEGEDCPVAVSLKESYMGRLVPLSRFILLDNSGLHNTEGIVYPSHSDGGMDLSIAVDNSDTPKAKWVDMERRPWRELTALLSFFSSEEEHNRFDCPLIRLGLRRARKQVRILGLWSGGLGVSSTTGEQKVSGLGDYVESEVYFDSSWLGEIWFAALKKEMNALEKLSQQVWAAAIQYYKAQLADGKKAAKLASNQFWQLCENKFTELVQACADESGKSRKVLRSIFASFAETSFNMFCPHETARQLDAWASSRPQLGNIDQSDFHNEECDMDTENSLPTSRGIAFTTFVIDRIGKDSGFRAALSRADNPATEYQSWEILSGWCDLEKPWELQPFATVAAALARSKPEQDGALDIGMAIAEAYPDGNKNDAAQRRLRRLLASTSVEDACAVLRPLLRLIGSRGVRLNHGRLLDQLTYFGEKTKLRWAVDFYGKRGDDDNLGL